MEPKEKADDLIVTFYDIIPQWTMTRTMRMRKSKQCALEAVDELIDQCKNFEKLYLPSDEFSSYWQEVKQEIEKF